MDKPSSEYIAPITSISHAPHALPNPAKQQDKQELRMVSYDLNGTRIADSNQRNARRLACTCCRQQKSKCDAQVKYPLPCTRCGTKGLSCELNKRFKRTEKRARLALIEREFSELKKSLQIPLTAVDMIRTAPALVGTSFGVTPSPASPSNLSQAASFSRMGTPHSQSPFYLGVMPVNSDLRHGSRTPKELEPNVQPSTGAIISQNAPFVNSHGPSKKAKSNTAQDIYPSPTIPESALVCEEKTLENVTLSPKMIKSLFLEYIRNYHSILPIVDVRRGPERIYRLCPALFWVIIYVTLRRFNDDKSLLVQLSPLIKNILAEITISPIARYNPTEEEEPIMNSCSVFSVQAFVLYSMWPPLTSSLSADSSWSTIGVALFQAIRLGLHTSGSLLEQYEGTKEQDGQYEIAQEQTKTWIFCNTVSQNIASAFGYPAFVLFDFLSVHHCEFSVSTRSLIELAQFEDQVCKTLGLATFSGTSQTNERLALLKVFANQLDDLDFKVVSESSQENGFHKLQFILARVHLLSFYFLDAENVLSFEISKGLVRLFNASCTLIGHVHMCQAKNSRFVEYLPAVSVLGIWQASFFIVKLAHSSTKSLVDVSAAKECYSVAVDLVAKASILRHDISYRASGIMRNMWQFYRRLDEKNELELRISIKSRMAASVFFDCLSLLRDKVGMAKFNIKTDVRGSTESNEENVGLSDEDLVQTHAGITASVSDNDTSTLISRQSSGSEQADSQRTMPGSFGSSARAQNEGALSDTGDAESIVRRIIRTIPLDPQPISASKRKTAHKSLISSSEILPSLNLEKENGVAASSTTPRFPAFPKLPIHGQPLPSDLPETLQNVENNPERITSGMFIPTAGLVDIDVLLEQDLLENNDSLWKDVDSLMNDFGFYA